MNRLAEILLNKPLDECSVQELQYITQKYPYFNAGHLLAVQKLQAEQSSQFTETFQKASLYFHPLYINQVISSNGNAEIIPATGFSAPASEITGSLNNEPISAVHEEPELPVQEQTDTKIETEQEKEVSVNNESSTNIESSVEDQVSRIAGQQDSEFDNIQSSHNDELIISKEQIETANQNQGSDNRQPVISDEPENTPPEQPTIAKQQTTPEQLTFEPYHTVDYFASQGIKVKLDENPTDKFSKQLKSFTEWLKTLKKLPDAENTTATIPASTEQKVDQLAETSLTDSNVITEAMAEVWSKQGNHEKAIEIYHKLSLLEPSKSIYFASLIEDLKKASL